MAQQRQLRVALNAVAARPGGGLAYLEGQLPHLETFADMVVYANPAVAEALRRRLTRAEVRELPAWARPLPLRLIWEHLVFPFVARDADVLYLVGSFTCLAARRPQVVVVQIPYVFGPEGEAALRLTRAPAWFRAQSALQRALGRLTLRQAKILVGISKFTVSQIARASNGRLDLRMVPNAGAALPWDGEYEPRTPLPRRPFALSVATDLPHKDRRGLIRAWPADGPLDLVLVGRSDHRSPGDLRNAVDARGNVHWAGAVDDRELAALYRRATLVVAHSYIEGFGMTPLEAMAADTPVIASNIPAHWEVCGEAALYYDLYDPDSLSSCVRRLLAEPELAKELIAAGRERAHEFSWVDNARQMLAILEEAAASHGGDDRTS